MRIKIIIFTIFTLVIFSSQTAIANNVFVNQEIFQGSTLEIKIPKFEDNNVSGTFDGKIIKFFEITQNPKTDEPISRGEFLKLLFDNSSLGENITYTDAIFPDVNPDNPFYEYVQKASQLDIVHGYLDGNFYPYEPVTRGQIAKILVNAFNPNPTLENPLTFKDVPEDHVFYDFIGIATQAELYKGYPDGLMRPDRSINFLEAEIVITRATNPENFIGIETKNYWRGYAGVHRLLAPGIKKLNLAFTEADTSTENLSFDINVLKRDFPVESFTLPESKTKLFGKEEQDNTWAMINGAKAKTNSSQLWENEFIVPTDGVTTLGFGDQVYINGSLSGSHFGIDYANNEGTLVHASNSGIVTLSDYTPSYGNTVIIDHGHNVFTMYLHMSELLVAKDQIVRKGDQIGKIGMTGIATGPHLHFTHFIGDVIVDNAEWY